jgi:hypothetical protein
MLGVAACGGRAYQEPQAQSPATAPGDADAAVLANADVTTPAEEPDPYNAVLETLDAGYRRAWPANFPCGAICDLDRRCPPCTVVWIPFEAVDEDDAPAVPSPPQRDCLACCEHDPLCTCDCPRGKPTPYRRPR